MTEPRLTVDEDALREARRDSLRNLLDRLQRMGLTETEASLLRQHVEAETRDADTARAVARSNLRHVKAIVPELERAEAERDRADEAARRALEQRQEMAAERYAWQERGDRAEAAIARVRQLADRWNLDGPPPGNRPYTELRAALDEPAAPVEPRDPCPRCEDCPLIPRHEMAQHQRDHHPETVDADDLTDYTAPDPPIGCITLTATPTHDPTQEPTP